jgi:allantoicase
MLLLSVGLTPSATADDPEPEISPMHAIVCRWTAYPAPYKVGTAVQSYVEVGCNYALDSANTEAAIQIYDRSIGNYRVYGNPTVSYKTGTTIRVYDGATDASGANSYRIRGTHFGQHGNIFALPTVYSLISVL